MMRLERVQAQQFASEMEVPHFYSTAAFTELNRHKAADVHYLLFGDGETRLGIILGETDEALKSPFRHLSEDCARRRNNAWRQSTKR